MIYVLRTYTETTEESSEHGEASDCGIVWEKQALEFRELVHMMTRGCFYFPSCYPAAGSVYEWYSTGSDIIDYETGTYREESIHYHPDNPPHKAKYWKLAAQAAGLVK